MESNAVGDTAIVLKTMRAARPGVRFRLLSANYSPASSIAELLCGNQGTEERNLGRAPFRPR
jgi:hypothetical protein